MRGTVYSQCRRDNHDHGMGARTGIREAWYLSMSGTEAAYPGGI